MRRPRSCTRTRSISAARRTSWRNSSGKRVPSPARRRNWSACGRTPPDWKSASSRECSSNEKNRAAHARDHDGAGRLCGPRADRVYHAGRRALRLCADVVDRARRRRHHPLHGDVRAVAAVAQKPVFAVVRKQLGQRLGVVTLIGSNLLNLITCAAELGAIAIVLHLFFGIDERFALVGATLVLGALVWLLHFQWIERTFGLSGLMMIVFGVAAWKLHPDWGAVTAGLVPRMPGHGSKDVLLYAYFAVGIFSALLMEYEVHFYSSGAIEEG